MIHILPVNDIREHEETTVCPCSPKVYEESGEWIVSHNRYDGREHIERLTDQDELKKIRN